MLSVLIPSYNYYLYPLAAALQQQCAAEGIPYEILCTDDGSGSAEAARNEAINALPGCRFMALKENLGLSGNRNLLASLAQYDRLLFIDGDSVVIRNDFIKKYISASQDADIVYGGRLHPDNAPSPRQTLRWKYGRFIEDANVQSRETNPYPRLLFNNTLIKRPCFEQIRFKDELNRYGHEDTLFAYRASLLQLGVKHIDNPVEHGDIDAGRVYLEKTRQGLCNLLSLYNSGELPPSFVKMLKLYQILEVTGLKHPGRLFYNLFGKALEKNLLSPNPSLFLFNIYRIAYLCSIRN